MGQELIFLGAKIFQTSPSTIMIQRKAAFIRGLRAKWLLSVHGRKYRPSGSVNLRGARDIVESATMSEPNWGDVVDRSLTTPHHRYSLPLFHRFGRGSSGEVAKKVVVPQVVVDKIIAESSNTGCWTDSPRGYTDEEGALPSAHCRGGAYARRVRGLGLEDSVACVQHGIGRAHTLYLRARGASSCRQPRRCGSQVIMLEQWESGVSWGWG